MKFGQMILGKITKHVVTRCQIQWLQDAQLSQRNRDAGKTGTASRQYFTDIIGLSSTTESDRTVI